MRPFAHLDSSGYYLTTAGARSHFHRHELACHDGCGLYAMDQITIDALEGIRLALGKPVFPTDGARCPRHNAVVDGKPRSQHLPRNFDGDLVLDRPLIGAGRAADISVRELTPAELWHFIRERADALGIRGLGWYPGFVHVDARDGDAWWDPPPQAMA